jgi:hypothetical protein
VAVVAEINRAFLAESEAPSYSVENLDSWFASACGALERTEQCQLRRCADEMQEDRFSEPTVPKQLTNDVEAVKGQFLEIFQLGSVGAGATLTFQDVGHGKLHASSYACSRAQTPRFRWMF